MKNLELNQMETIQGGDGLSCGLGIVTSVGGAVLIGFMFAFPPAAGMAALLGAISGVVQGATMAGTGISCLT